MDLINHLKRRVAVVKYYTNNNKHLKTNKLWN